MMAFVLLVCVVVFFVSVAFVGMGNKHAVYIMYGATVGLFLSFVAPQFAPFALLFGDGVAILSFMKHRQSTTLGKAQAQERLRAAHIKQLEQQAPLSIEASIADIERRIAEAAHNNPAQGQVVDPLCNRPAVRKKVRVVSDDTSYLTSEEDEIG